MMSSSRSYHRDDSVSDAVFSEDESDYPDIYAPRLSHFFSPNVSMTSLRDLYSPRDARDVSRESYSPTMSNYSTYSQEVKYIFDPNFGSQQQQTQPHSGNKLRTPSAQVKREYSDPAMHSTEDDYSQIQFSNKKSNSVQRKLSNSSQYSYKGQYVGHSSASQVTQGHQGQSSNQSQAYYKGSMHQSMQNIVPPPPPPRTSSSASSHKSYQGEVTHQKSYQGEVTHQKSYQGEVMHKSQQGEAMQKSQQGEIMQKSQQGEVMLTTRQQKSSLSHSASYSSSYYYPSNPNVPTNHSRRKTWSPDGIRGGINVTSVRREQRLRSYSNEQLLEPAVEREHHIYEELEAGPPKLAPISGMLNKSPGRGIIRPIAFKPVVANQKFVNSPKQYADHPRKYSSHDDGYGSQDYGMTNHNAANTSHGSGSSHMDCDRSTSFSSDCNRASDRSDSVPASHLSRLSSNHMESYVQTPSPSDSGVGELEAILKEKDAEINILRDVMDKNERAIFQVYEDKKGCWLRDIQEIKEDYENKLKTLQRKSYKSEQVLNLQLFKLQQEKKGVKEDMDKLNSEKEDLVQKCEAYAEETNRLQAQMDDATWQGRRPSNASSDVNDLQNQIDNLHSKLIAKSNEVLNLQSKLDDSNTRESCNTSSHYSDKLNANLSSGNMPRMNMSCSDTEPDIPLCQCEKEIQTDFVKANSPEQETLKPSIICEKDKELNSLRDDLDKLRLELLVNKEEYDKEKEQWLEEKNKVIMYQKQLQLNYVQMFRKNKVLEAEVEQLTLELESRDMKLMALNGEESVC